MIDSELTQPRCDIICKELELVSNKINHFDGLRYNTRQMVITIWVGVVGASVSLKISGLLLLATFISIPFWYVEATYHSYQEGFNARLKALQTFLQTGEYRHLKGWEEFPLPDFYGTHTLPAAEHARLTSITANAFKLKTLLFYIPLALLPSVGWLLGLVSG